MSSSDEGSSVSGSDEEFETPAGSVHSKSPKSEDDNKNNEDTVHSQNIPVNCPKGYKPVNLPGTLLNNEELNSDDYEAWIVSAPADISVKHLQNSKLHFRKEKTITVGKKQYETVPYPASDKHVNLLFLDSSRQAKVVDLKISGELRVNEHEEVPDIVYPEKEPKKTPQVPTDLKVRHPIYGIDYEKVIEGHKKFSQSVVEESSPQKKRKGAVPPTPSSLDKSSAKKKKKKKVEA